MPAMAFSDFDVLPDVLATDRFEILLAPAAGATNLNATLAVRCTQMTIPQEMTEPMLVAIQGMEFNFRGRRTFDKAVQATFVETADGAVQNSLRGWTQKIAGSESGNGVSKKQYATVGTINVFDQSGNTALSFQLDNAWPSDLAQVQLESSQANPYYQSTTFTYDRLRPPNGISIS